MKPAPFEYIRPETVDDVVAFKAAYEGDASVLAGGQSLIPMLNFRLARPAALLDLGAVAGLDRLEVSDEAVRVGAMVRQARLERDGSAMRACPLLGQALANVAHPAIRNRGTVGGTIAHADASAEMPAALLALDGEVTAQGLDGERTIPAAELFEFHLTTSLAPEEVLTAVRLPRLAPRTGSAFVEFARRHGDYAIVGVAAVVTLDAGGRVVDARLAYSGIAPTPVRAAQAEAGLRGQQPDEAVFAEAGEAAAGCVDAVDEEQASVAYRRHLVRTLTVRALTEASERARREEER